MKTMIPFGLLGVLVVRFINPIFFGFLNSIDNHTFEIVSLISFAIFVIDLVVSLFVLCDVGKENKMVKKDNTEEIRKIVLDRIFSLGWLHRRLINAFPNIKIILNDTKEKLEDNIKEYNQKQKKLRKKQFFYHLELRWLIGTMILDAELNSIEEA